MRLLECTQGRKIKSVSEVRSFEGLHPVGDGCFVQQWQLLEAQQSEIGVVVVVQGWFVAAEHHMPHRSRIRCSLLRGGHCVILVTNHVRKLLGDVSSKFRHLIAQCGNRWFQVEAHTAHMPTRVVAVGVSAHKKAPSVERQQNHVRENPVHGQTGNGDVPLLLG